MRWKNANNNEHFCCDFDCDYGNAILNVTKIDNPTSTKYEVRVRDYEWMKTCMSMKILIWDMMNLWVWLCDLVGNVNNRNIYITNKRIFQTRLI